MLTDNRLIFWAGGIGGGRLGADACGGQHQQSHTTTRQQPASRAASRMLRRYSSCAHASEATGRILPKDRPAWRPAGCARRTMPLRAASCAGAAAKVACVGFVEYDFVAAVNRPKDFPVRPRCRNLRWRCPVRGWHTSSQVQVGAADPRPCAVDEGGFGVQHGAVPLEHAHTRVQ